MRVGLCCVRVLGTGALMGSLVLTGRQGGSMGLLGSLTGTWDIANGLWRLL